MKKIFLISVSLFAVTLLFLGVYNIAFRNNPRNAVTDDSRKADAKKEADSAFAHGSDNAGISLVTDIPAYGAIDLDDSHIAYFNERSLKRSALDGGGEEVLIENLPGKILDVAWAPNRERVIVLFETEQENRWYLVEISDSSVKPLKSGITSPKWSNLSDRIFYFYTDPASGKTELDSAKPNGADWKKLTDVSETAVFLSSVPSSALISFWNRPSAFEETSLYTIPATGGTAKLIFSEKFGADYLWSPDGAGILISNTLSKGGSETRLGLANQDGGEFRTLQTPTIVSKVAWSKDGQTIYYALPLSIPENTVLPNDYFSRPVYTEDLFWKMDIATGKTDRLIDPSNMDRSFDATNFFLDHDGAFLYFTDRIDGKIYRLPVR